MAHHKKHPEHEEHVDESWLIPYADLLTLLLAVFIVMYAASSQNKSKMESMAAVFTKEFGLFTPLSKKIGISTTSPIQSTTLESGVVDKVDDQKKAMVENLQKDFETYVIENELAPQIQIQQLDNGLLVTLTGDVWFQPGSATINEKHRQTAHEVSGMISKSISENANLDFEITVSGYTDNRPINNAQFKSNWALSSMRAVNFLEALLETSGLNPATCVARGLGENSPVDTNDTPEGRQKNRRVEISISFAGDTTG